MKHASGLSLVTNEVDYLQKSYTAFTIRKNLVWAWFDRLFTGIMIGTIVSSDMFRYFES